MQRSLNYAVLYMVATSCLHAVTINFDDSDYMPGNPLHGRSQPSGIKWSGEAGAAYFEVLPEGVDGSNAVVTKEMTEAQSNLYASIDPSIELNDFDWDSSVLDVSFQVRYLEEPTEGRETVAAIWFGRAGAHGTAHGVRLGFQADGMLQYIDGEKRIVLENFLIRPEDSWVTVSVRMDYKTKEYSFSINDVPQGGTYSFVADSSAKEVPRIMIQNMITPEHRSLAFDNFTMEIGTRE